ncbi:uncharacterized protein LOC8274856 [Ricinus communis]|uniref:uncharacterized protein LOC8274856 n=1 Tax=Ricinus communis TaxID=3988 RepID=UPI00201AE025|nr:uncharacterized protein LOC8274856 [Ricinus communis]XP_048231826.1 uncharacterized protein LOC8274856 [Ricinus communis]
MDSDDLEPIPITSQKHDPAWKHCQMFKNGERVQLKCVYCGKIFKGGGIHRIKEHLAGQKGNASTCLQVPTDVKLIMQQSLDGVVVKKRKKQKIAEEITNLNPVIGGGEIEVFANDQIEVSTGMELIGVSNVIEPSSSLLISGQEGKANKGGERRKRGRSKGSGANANAIVSMNSNRMALGAKRVNDHVHMAIGRFLYDIGAPLDAVNSVYFQPMVDAIASGGLDVGMPSCHDLRGWILKNSVEEVKTEVDKHMATWARTGCSVLVDQWNTLMGRTLLSFLVYCSEGVVFLKSVDASDIINSSDALYELIKKVVEEVGVRHVLQVITSMEEQYIVVGRRLTDTFPTLYWAPCAAHCIDLILEDFAKLEWISTVILQARSITRFVYNHSVVLNMVKRYTFGSEIVATGLTHFATNFETLKRMVDLKHTLQTMVTSQEWMDCPYSKKPRGLEMLDLLSNQSFWSSCVLITNLTNPLLRLLRIVSSKKRPPMGYVYAGIYRAKEAIKKELVKRKDYMVYWNIIDHWWEQQSNLPLHAAGFFLNPKVLYSIEGDLHNEILSGMFDCIEKLVPDVTVQDKITKEINSYKNASGDFGRKMAVRARETLLPAEWWSTYGGSCPNLARLAIRVLSQPCSSFGYKLNHISLEQIHDTKNCLERQRLSDLVFVQYNLRLKQMVGKSEEQDSVDPLSFDCISILEDWIKEKDISTEDYANSDWMALDPPSVNTRQPHDEVDELGAGFHDYEIFNRVKDTEDDNDE